MQSSCSEQMCELLYLHYWTCFRRIHLKTVMFLPFKFPFQNIFSELRQIIKINHICLAETSMFSSRFAWLMIFPDRQSVSWRKPGKTDHGIQNKLRCCMFKMLLLSNLIIRKKMSKASLFIASFQGFIYLFIYFPLKLHVKSLVVLSFVSW